MSVQDDAPAAEATATPTPTPTPTRAWWKRILHDPIVGLLTSVIVILATLVIGLVVGVSPSESDQADWENVETGLLIALSVLVAIWLVTLVRVATRDDSSRRTSYLEVPISGWKQLAIEATAMAQYASKQGTATRAQDREVLYRYETLDAAGVKKVEEGGAPELVAGIALAHADLAAKLRPATPHTIALLTDQSSRRRLFAWLGSVRLVRMLIGLSVLLLIAFVLLATSSGAQIDGVDDLVSTKAFDTKVLAALYLLVAAALGASFAALRKTFGYIGNLSYDEKYESSYWIRFVQGVTAGLILSILLGRLLFGGDDANDTGFRVTLPLLAFVGGFSEDLVFRILRRIIEALMTLATGSIDDEVDARAAQLEIDATQRQIKVRRDIAASLLALKEELPADATAARGAIDAEVLRVLDPDAAPRDDPSTTAGNPPDSPDSPENPDEAPDPPEAEAPGGGPGPA